MNQPASSKPTIEEIGFPWDLVMMTPIWLVFAFISVAFPHKTFPLSSLEIPMTPLLLFFAASLIFLVYEAVIEKEEFGFSIFFSLTANSLVFFPVPIAWFLLSFYEVSTFPSFLAVLIFPIIFLSEELTNWFKSPKTEAPTGVRGIRRMAKPFKLVGVYVSGLFFGYGTIITVGYLYCHFTNQSFEMFARANPAVFLLGGATIMAGILALSRPSR